MILFRSRCAIAPGLKSYEIEGVVTGAYKAEQAEANNACRVLDTWGVGENVLNLFRRFARTLQRSRIRKLHVDEDIALVFIGKEARRQTAAKETCAHAERRNHHQGQRTLAKNPTADSNIDLGAAPEHAIDPVKELAEPPVALPLWPKQ